MKKNEIKIMARQLSRLAAIAMLLVLPLLASCGEDDTTAEEFPNWRVTNENYFNELYQTAQARIAAGDSQWKLFRSWSLPVALEGEPQEYIIVKVLNEGTGSGCPLYTDSVQVHYSGRLLPSTHYPEGFVFDKSYTGDYDLETMMPATFGVSALIDGFTTALQRMHIGDRWQVYIPQQLGYKSSATSSIPAYSTLIFDITLVAYYRPGQPVPPYRAKRK